MEAESNIMVALVMLSTIIAVFVIWATIELRIEQKKQRRARLEAMSRHLKNKHKETWRIWTASEVIIKSK